MLKKTIKLTGEYPSDFTPGLNVSEIRKHFDAYKFYDGRMISGNKRNYESKHIDDLIVFNANVLMPGYGKVWYGDLNLTEDYLVLRDIAQTLDTTLYVLWEMDARFGEEMESLNELLNEAVWNTDEDNPTKEWYREKVNEDLRNIPVSE